jgi:hypothetical protein
MTNPEIAFDAGDVLLTRPRGMASWLTCWATGPAAHQATFFDADSIVEAAIGRGRIVRTPWLAKRKELEDGKGDWIIFHWEFPPMVPMLRTKVQCDLAEAMEFEKYSYLELPLQAFDSLWNRVIRRRQRQGYDAYVFRRMGDIWDNGVICSKTSNRALIRNGFVGKASGLEYGSPSDTYRYLRERVGKEVMVAEHSDGWFNASGT